MLTRRYTFDDTDQGALFYKMCYLALASRGSAEPMPGRPAPRQTKEDHRSEAKILAALKKIGTPVEGAGEIARGEFDVRVRQLQEGGGVIELEQPEYKLLQKYVEDHQWATVLVDVSTALEDSLDAQSELVDSSTGVVPSPTSETSA